MRRRLFSSSAGRAWKLLGVVLAALGSVVGLAEAALKISAAYGADRAYSQARSLDHERRLGRLEDRADRSDDRMARMQADTAATRQMVEDIHDEMGLSVRRSAGGR